MHTTLDFHSPRQTTAMKFRYEPESRPLDGYTIKRAIQRGGFGEVYFALSDAGKEVALKLLQDNLDVELRGLSHCLNLKHPNLISIFDVRQTPAGEHWVVMEYMGGQALDQVIAAHPSGLPLERVESILSGIAAGVGYLHEQGIVHRDLKPGNIFEEHGRIKVGDVGLAKFISESHRSGHTQSVGTVYYMAPEIAHGRYGREVDVYALGVILFEMLTGKVPFDGESTGEILMKQLTQVPDLSAVPTKFRAVLEHALEKDPARRTASVQELAEEFRAALQGDAVVREARPQREGPAYAHGERLNQPHAERRGRTDWDRPRNAFERFMEPAPGLAWYEDSRNWWMMGGAALLLLIVAPIPSVLIGLPLVSMALFGLMIWLSFHGVLWIVKELSRPHGAVPTRSGRAWRLNTLYVRHHVPETDRHLRLIERGAEVTGAMAVSGVCAAAFAAVLLLTHQLLRGMTDAVFFTVATTLAAWAAILPAKLMEGNNSQRITRRLATGMLGMIAGYGVFLTDQMLSVGLLMGDGFPPLQALSETLSNTLHVPESKRMAGYLTFFGGLMLVRRWWYHVDAWRPKRLSRTSAGITTLAGCLLSGMIEFPVEWGGLLALSSSVSAQLASVWVRPEHRAVELMAGHDAPMEGAV